MILHQGRSSVVPTLRYRDLDRAVPWLCAAFGFTARGVVLDADGRIASAQIVSGNGMVMLAPVGRSGFDDLMKQPDEIGGAETQSCYFVIADSDAHYAAATAQGAEIVLDLQSFENGGRGYLCRDLEGHLWSFGTFDPWSAGQAADTGGLLSRLLGLVADPRRQLAAAGVSAAGLVAGGAALAVLLHGAPVEPAAPAQVTQGPSAIALFKERGARLAAQRELASLRSEKDAIDGDGDKLREQLEHLTIAKEAAERAARRLVAKAMGERQQRTANRRRSDDLAQGLEKERQGKQRSERAFQNLKVQLEKELLAKDGLERGKLETEAALAKERDARKRAELALQQAAERLKQEQEARKSAEVAGQQAPAAAKTEKQLSPPRPAKRPDAKPAPQKDGAETDGEPTPVPPP